MFGIYVKKLFWHGDQGNKKKPESIVSVSYNYSQIFRVCLCVGVGVVGGLVDILLTHLLVSC